MVENLHIVIFRSLLVLILLLQSSLSFASINNIEEEDGSPSVYPWKLKVTNGTLTNHGDGSASLAIAGGTGDITDVGNISTGAAGQSSANDVTFGNIQATRIGSVSRGDATFNSYSIFNGVSNRMTTRLTGSGYTTTATDSITISADGGLTLTSTGNTAVSSLTTNGVVRTTGGAGTLTTTTGDATFLGIRGSSITGTKIGNYGAADATFTDTTISSLTASRCIETNASGKLVSAGAACGVGDITLVGDCTTGACFDGSSSSGTIMTWDTNGGANGVDGTLDYSQSNNYFTMKNGGYDDAGSNYWPVISLTGQSTNTDAYAHFKAVSAGSQTIVGTGHNGYGFLIGHDGGSNGGGIAFYRDEVLPIDVNGTSAAFINTHVTSPTNNVISLGSSTYRWSNVYSTSGNFSSNVSVVDDAYAAGWNGSTNVPTKNAIYDKIETLGAGDITDVGNISSGAAGQSSANDVTFGNLQATRIGSVSAGDATFSFGNITGRLSVLTDDRAGSALQVGDLTTVDSNSYITFGDRVTASQTNVPFIGQDSLDGAANSLGLGARSTNGAIHFYAGNSSAFDTAYLRMTIKADGTVGVGYTNPGRTFSVNGSMMASGDATFGSINSSKIGNTTAADATFTTVRATNATGVGNAFACFDANGKLYRASGTC